MFEFIGNIFDNIIDLKYLFIEYGYEKRASKVDTVIKDLRAEMILNRRMHKKLECKILTVLLNDL